MAEPPFRGGRGPEGGLSTLPVFPQGGVQRCLGWRQLDGKWYRFLLVGKRRAKTLLVDVFLQSPHTNLGQVRSVLPVHLDRHLEADGVEQFEQPGEADSLAIVR